VPKTITFTAPPAAITNLTATLQAGGSLVAGTTYYYVVLTCVGSTWYNQAAKISGISNQVSAACDAGNKTIRLDWPAVAGASGYLVFRTTVDGDYTGTKRFRKESNNDSWGFTTTNNYYVDAGAATPVIEASYMLPVIPATKTMPMGLDPRTYGIGDLVLEGGTSGDPITFQNIYDAAVSGGWTNWCKWDKGNFALMANFRSSANETHFADLIGSNFFTLGWFDLNRSQSAASDFIFGTLANGSGFYPTKIVHVAGRGAEFCIGLNVKLYGTDIVGVASALTSPFYVTGINASQFLSFISASLVDLRVSGFNDFSLQSLESFSKDLKFMGSWTMHTGSPILTQGTEVNYISGSVSNGSRIDRFRSIRSSSYHITQSSSGVGYYNNLIDPYTPNIYEPNNLPTVSWYASIFNDYCDVYRSLILRIVDRNDNAIVGASVTIKDVSGNVAADFNGTSINNLATDSQGYLWLEKVTVTAATTTTISDSSKNWTVDQWKGRNLYIVAGTQRGKIIKIKSNTATQLTLCETLSGAPVVGDTVGIKLEIKQARLTHKAATGAGYGDAYTTKDIKTPHTFIIFKNGYKSRSIPLTLNRALDLSMGLLPLGYPPAPWGA
jgi:hypothetical protein